MVCLEDVLFDVLGSGDDDVDVNVSSLILDYLPQEEQYPMVSTERQRLLEFRHCETVEIFEISGWGRMIKSYFVFSNGQKLMHSIAGLPSFIQYNDRKVAVTRNRNTNTSMDIISATTDLSNPLFQWHILGQLRTGLSQATNLSEHYTIPMEGEPRPRQVSVKYELINNVKCVTTCQTIFMTIDDGQGEIHYSLSENYHFFALEQHALLYVKIPRIDKKITPHNVPTFETKVHRHESVCIETKDCLAHEWTREFKARQHDISLLLQYFQPPSPSTLDLNCEQLIKELADWEKKRDCMLAKRQKCI